MANSVERKCAHLTMGPAGSMRYCHAKTRLQFATARPGCSAHNSLWIRVTWNTLIQEMT